MNKPDLVKEAAEKTRLSADDAARAVDLVYDHIADIMHTGGKLGIRGFGTFTWREKKPWPSRNPKNGNTTLIPARRMPHFQAGPALKEFVNSRQAASKNRPRKAPARS